MPDIIRIRVIPNAKKNEVKREGQRLKVYLTAAPVRGKANKQLIEILAEYFGCRKSELRIIKGEGSRDKLVERIV